MTITSNYAQGVIAGASSQLIEDLSHGRVRILTQETQKGKPAEALANAKPNPMINGHQDWLDGFVKAARDAKE